MVPARLVLYMLSFTGFLVSFMMRSDINLTIVAMVKLRTRSIVDNVTVVHCYSSSTNIPFNNNFSIHSSSSTVNILLF